MFYEFNVVYSVVPGMVQQHTYTKQFGHDPELRAKEHAQQVGKLGFVILAGNGEERNRLIPASKILEVQYKAVEGPENE